MPRTPRTERARASATLRVRVQARASREAIVGWREDALRVAVTAPPVEGEANQAVRRLLARALGVAPSAVSLVGGEHGRDKVVRIEGMTGVELHSRLADRGHDK
ncbi:MAG TPA: DUF167 domain-containing protein [Candidatus Acidoferrum sp.]|nr:DUF167 domain-containing protein [Candidatus Acidoferrum sp.]